MVEAIFNFPAVSAFCSICFHAFFARHFTARRGFREPMHLSRLAGSRMVFSSHLSIVSSTRNLISKSRQPLRCSLPMYLCAASISGFGYAGGGAEPVAAPIEVSSHRKRGDYPSGRSIRRNSQVKMRYIAEVAKGIFPFSASGARKVDTRLSNHVRTEPESKQKAFAGCTQEWLVLQDVTASLRLSRSRVALAWCQAPV